MTKQSSLGTTMARIGVSESRWLRWCTRLARDMVPDSARKDRMVHHLLIVSDFARAVEDNFRYVVPLSDATEYVIGRWIKEKRVPTPAMVADLEDVAKREASYIWERELMGRGAGLPARYYGRGPNREVDYGLVMTETMKRVEERLRGEYGMAVEFVEPGIL